jgi:hypothetical protein
MFQAVMEEHFGTTLGKQGAEPWLKMCIVSKR